MRREDLRRLERLETPSRANYVVARNRAFAWTLSSFDVELEAHEVADLGDYGEADFASDCDLLGRYRSSLDAESRRREQRTLLRDAYRELERRGVDPWAALQEV